MSNEASVCIEGKLVAFPKLYKNKLTGRAPFSFFLVHFSRTCHEISDKFEINRTSHSLAILAEISSRKKCPKYLVNCASLQSLETIDPFLHPKWPFCKRSELYHFLRVTTFIL